MSYERECICAAALSAGRGLPLEGRERKRRQEQGWRHVRPPEGPHVHGLGSLGRGGCAQTGLARRPRGPGAFFLQLQHANTLATHPFGRLCCPPWRRPCPQVAPLRAISRLPGKWAEVIDSAPCGPQKDVAAALLSFITDGPPLAFSAPCLFPPSKDAGHALPEPRCTTRLSCHMPKPLEACRTTIQEARSRPKRNPHSPLLTLAAPDSHG